MQKMRLKKVVITGFKSFADRTKLEFHEGITAIVGPNGCGKSNIVDAFRWGLGEQSAKSMRGGKMDDVIFAGSAQRKPVNLAEVSIVLTDVEGDLPTPYAEVEITRRLHRNGEADYLLNRHPVRLKDIQGLLLGSGMGKNAFSIFEQGKIDQIIQYTPIERRRIFEEAAGIARFLQRKGETLRELESAERDRLRVKDIHAEVSGQIAVLAEQAAQARLFLDKKQQLEQEERALFLCRWESLQRKRNETLKKKETQEKSTWQSQDVLQTALTGLHQEKVALDNAEKAFRVKSEQLYQARSEKEIRFREKHMNQERARELATKEARWKRELEELVMQRKSRQQECVQGQRKKQEIEGQLVQAEQALKIKKSGFQLLEMQVAELRSRQQQLQQERMRLLKAEAALESEWKQQTIRLESLREKKEQLQRRQSESEQLMQELAEQLVAHKQSVEEVYVAVETKKEQLVALDHSLQQLAEQMAQSQRELDQQRAVLAEMKARQKALIKLREELEGFSEGSKKLLAEAKDPTSPFFGRIKGLYEYITLKQEDDGAVAAVLKAYAQTLVVESRELFHAVVTFAKNQKLKDFSLFCLEGVAPCPLDGSWPCLLDRVLDNAVAHHFLAPVQVVPSITDACSAAQQKAPVLFWSAEKALVDQQQVTFFISEGGNNIFLREAEIKGLTQKIEAKEKTLHENESLLKLRKQRHAELYEERNAVDKSARKLEMRLVEVNFTLQRTQGDYEKAKRDKEAVIKEGTALEAGMQELDQRIAQAKQQYEQVHAQALQMQEQAVCVEEELEAQLDALRQRQAELKGEEAAYQQLSDSLQQVLHLLNVIEVKDRQSEYQEQHLREEIEQSQTLFAESERKKSEYDGQLEAVEQVLEVASAACLQIEEELKSKKERIQLLESEIEGKRQLHREGEKAAAQLGLLLAQLQASEEGLVQELYERYQLSIEQLEQQAFRGKGSIDHLEKEVRRLKRELEGCGAINMAAIEECERQRERHAFLQQQLQDIEKSRTDLLQVVAQLDKESRSLFKEMFNKIQVNFRKNFAILFSGGDADLQLTETSDVLEAGIEIIARPPGKQMRSISLLSGGEKCLTAMALLFAIFEVKPSPFCILDEIDAPLDDSNVERFTNLVREFIDRCQFIIITHNKRTMAMADRLFGVSMQEKGVSKILSLEFSHAETEDDRPALSLVLERRA